MFGRVARTFPNFRVALPEATLPGCPRARTRSLESADPSLRTLGPFERNPAPCYHPRWRASRFEVAYHMHSASRHRQFARRENSRTDLAWHRRQAISLFVLLGIVCTYFPIPVSPGSVSGAARAEHAPVKKDRSRPFPCAQRVCGCQSAEQCWRKCCCFTDAQKVAWADTHGVELPDFVRQAAARSAVAHRRTTCLETKSGRNSCARCEPGKPAALSQSKATRTRHRSRPESDPQLASTEVVIVQHALACQGLSWQWQFDPGTAPRPPMVAPGVQPPLAGQRPVSALAWGNPPLHVPVPPPRTPVRPGSSA